MAFTIKAQTATAPFAQEDAARESRLQLALLREVLESLKPNRLMVPLFAVAICLLFSPSVPAGALALWFALVLLALAPQILVSHFLPPGTLSPPQARRWIWLGAAAYLIQAMAWTSMGALLWAPGHDFNHLLLLLVLATSLSTQGALIGPSHQIAIPVFCLNALVMTAVPLQAHDKVFEYLAAVMPLYVGYVAVMARQHHQRARAALLLAEERNGLLAELVCAKLESDRGRERAEAASLAKSQFLANMSHELRTPLNAIIGFSELISTRIFESEPDRNYEYAGLIHGSGLHLLTLINDILDLAKIEAGRWKLEEAEVDLHRMTADTFQLVAWKAEAGNVALKNRIAADLPFLFADSRAIKQILTNLLSNAVKFTQGGGKVSVAAELDTAGRCRLSVSDTGVGIAPEDLERVFDCFGQGKHDVSIVDKGTGLGLAIVKGLTEAHGGMVLLESEIDKGTRVTITLPAERVRARESLESRVA